MKFLIFLVTICFAIATSTSASKSSHGRRQAATISTDAQLEKVTGRLPWATRAGDEYKRTSMGKKIMEGFERVLHPILDSVLDRHPEGAKLKQLRSEGKVEIHHHMVAMRDGVRLSTFTINPAPFNQTKSTMIGRSPYGPTSDAMAAMYIVLNGFAAVIQDQRGTFMSEGDFSMWHDDALDGFDTLAWIEQQHWSNGKVYSIGVSADGCGSAAMILSQPPQLKGQVIMWASMNGHETSFPGGAFREGLLTGWMSMMAPLTHGYSLEHTLPNVIAHESLSEWWTPIQGPGHFHQADWPTIHIAGLWDIFEDHHLEMFDGLSQHSTGHEHVLFLGPLGHCMLGNLDAMLTLQEAQGIVNAIEYSSQIFGESTNTVKSSTMKDKIKRINVYVQGSRAQGSRGEGKVGHYWTSFDQWPEPKIHRLLLGKNHGLELESTQSRRRSLRPSGNKRDDANRIRGQEYEEFIYNPANPHEHYGGNLLILLFLERGCASEDQRRSERRSDMVTFTATEAMDRPLALMGKVKAVLYVSTNRNDTDFYVSLTDVHPDGSSMQIRYGLQRMRWRESTTFKSVKSTTLPGAVYRIEINMWLTSYIVAPGHRLRVSVGSASSLYYAKNDNSGVDTLGLKYKLPALNRVYFSSDLPSHIELPIVDLEAIQRNEKF